MDDDVDMFTGTNDDKQSEDVSFHIYIINLNFFKHSLIK